MSDDALRAEVERLSRENATLGRMVTDECALRDRDVKELAEARARIVELEREREEARKGPYGIRECRGHFHVTCGDMDLIGGPYDRATAEQEAAAANVRWNTGKERLEARVTALSEALKRMVDGSLLGGVCSYCLNDVDNYGHAKDCDAVVAAALLQEEDSTT